MMVRYFALLRDATGKSEEEWKQPAANVGELLFALAAHYGPEFARWVLKDGTLWDLVIVLVNGHDVRHAGGGLATPLTAEDTVVIFPPVGGG
jgi:MoaD family protein